MTNPGRIVAWLVGLAGVLIVIGMTVLAVCFVGR